MASRSTIAQALLAAGCLLAACASLDRPATGTTRDELADWAERLGFQAATLPAPPFRLFSLLRQRAPADALVVYLEGDGAAWPTPYRPPRDPSPSLPTALLLARQDDAGAVAYLARPCQYPEPGHGPACADRYWTGERFAEPVLNAMDHAVDQLKARSGARRLSLVGYSGGGVIATLLALRRDDVDALVTVAAPLALAEWTRRQGISPLPASLDPLAQAALPNRVSAIHLAGQRDDVVPAAVIARYAAARGGRLAVLAGFDHDCCWQRDWPQILKRLRAGETWP